MGYNTGQHDKGSRNTFLGSQAGVLLADNDQLLFNATAIGAGAVVAASNALILGNNANVGIGTSAPATRLEVVGEAPDASGLRLTKLTAYSRPATATDEFLTVDAVGNVVKARYKLRISNASEWSDNVFSRTYRLKPLASVADYIHQHGHLPGIPSAQQVVQEGVDLTRLNAALLGKIEELTLYGIQMEKAVNQQQATIQQQQTDINTLKLLVKQLLEKK